MSFDEDMKIAGEKPSQGVPAEPEDGQEIAEKLMSEKEQGLFDRAWRLGGELAQALLDSNDFTYDDSDGDTYNKRILLAFSAISSIESRMCSDNAANEALNSLLEGIKERDSRLYSDICGAGELSFYYLAVKRGDAGTSVGKMFAMICGREGDEAYIRRGTEIYEGFAALALSKIEEYGLGSAGAEASHR